MQFQVFTRDTLTSYFQLLVQEAINLISKSEWFLKHNDTFNNKRALEIFYKQLHGIINICYHQMSSICNISLVYPFMQHLTQLYSFMTKLLQHVSNSPVFNSHY